MTIPSAAIFWPVDRLGERGLDLIALVFGPAPASRNTSPAGPMASWNAIASATSRPTRTGASTLRNSICRIRRLSSCPAPSLSFAIENGPGPQVCASAPGSGRKRRTIPWPSKAKDCPRGCARRYAPCVRRASARGACCEDRNRIGEEHRSETGEYEVELIGRQCDLGIASHQADILDRPLASLPSARFEKGIAAIDRRPLRPPDRPDGELDRGVAEAAADVEYAIARAPAGLERPLRCAGTGPTRMCLKRMNFGASTVFQNCTNAVSSVGGGVGDSTTLIGLAPFLRFSNLERSTDTAIAPRMLGRFLRKTWNFREEAHKRCLGCQCAVTQLAGRRVVWRPTGTLIEFVGWWRRCRSGAAAGIECPNIERRSLRPLFADQRRSQTHTKCGRCSSFPCAMHSGSRRFSVGPLQRGCVASMIALDCAFETGTSGTPHLC